MADQPTAKAVRRYAADAQPGGVGSLLAWAYAYPKLVHLHRDLVWNLCRVEFVGRFRGSVLGFLWVLLQPVFLFIVYYLVFGILFGPRHGDGAPNAHYAIYLFAGVIAWTSLSGSVSRACGVVTATPNLVRSPGFPAEILPLPLILTDLATFLGGAVVLLGIGLATGSLQIGLPLLILPLLILLHLAFTLGIALALATGNVFIKDIGHAYAMFAVAWFFLSPVIWDLPLLEQSVGAWSRLAWCNPAYPLLQLHRDVFGISNGDQLAYHLGATALWATTFMTVGHRLCLRFKSEFADAI